MLYLALLWRKGRHHFLVYINIVVCGMVKLEFFVGHFVSSESLMLHDDEICLYYC